jgi:hypothetical protein
MPLFRVSLSYFSLSSFPKLKGARWMKSRCSLWISLKEKERKMISESVHYHIELDILGRLEKNFKLCYIFIDLPLQY